jgi:ATP-dependent DNA helicase RecG
MEKTNIGSELAEYDLELRGAGEIYGTAQHGTKYFKVANFSDTELIKKTRDEAEKIIKKMSSYPALEKKVSELNAVRVSPD